MGLPIYIGSWIYALIRRKSRNAGRAGELPSFCRRSLLPCEQRVRTGPLLTASAPRSRPQTPRRFLHGVDGDGAQGATGSPPGTVARVGAELPLTGQKIPGRWCTDVGALCSLLLARQRPTGARSRAPPNPGRAIRAPAGPVRSRSSGS